MSILSVPLTPKLENMINKMVEDGVASNKAELARMAIEKLAEERAIADVLEAEREPALSGDLDELVKRFK
jgi:Arc/MetJ-type ribon-helix-helix transcriptional regulator